jgi:inorganic pyrophosphatase
MLSVKRYKRSLTNILADGTQGKWSLQGKTVYQGLKICIENKAGSIRSGKEPSGKKWSIKMPFDYGYVDGTKGKDGDEVDCFLGPDKDATHVFIIHQRQHDTKDVYDEDKVMLGWNSADAAKKAYHSAYNNANLFISMTMMSIDEFKDKLKSLEGKKINAEEETNGEWRTIRGQHIFIKDGESVKDAFDRVLSKEKNERNIKSPNDIKKKIFSIYPSLKKSASYKDNVINKITSVKNWQKELQRLQELKREQSHNDVIDKQKEVKLSSPFTKGDKQFNSNLSSAVTQALKDIKDPDKAFIVAAKNLGFSKDEIDNVKLRLQNWVESSDELDKLKSEFQKVRAGDPNADKGLVLQHEVTKQYLESRYGNTVPLYRGIVTDTNSKQFGSTAKALDNAADNSKYKSFTIPHSGAESWTDKKDVAQEFAEGGVILKTKMPIENIMTSYLSNKSAFKGGNNYQHEFIVAFKGKKLILDSKSTQIKNDSDMSGGGPGSGRHPTGRKNKFVSYLLKGNKPADLQKHSREDKLAIRRAKQLLERQALNKQGLSQRGKPIVSDKAQRALASMNVANKPIHDLAEKTENKVNQVLGAVKSHDNSPFDVTTKIGNRNIGVEVKALVTQKNDKITQKGDAIDRKMSYGKANGIKSSGMYTVAVDYRSNRSNPDVYIRQGVGSFRIGNMEKINGGFKGLKNYFGGSK